MKVLTKVISGLVIGGTIITSTTVALAANTTSAAANSALKSRPAIAGKMMRGGGMDKGFFGKGEIKNNIENDLKTLVSAGVITQEESDKILALSKQETTACQAEMDKVRNMSADERKAYFDSLKGQTPEKKGDLFTQAVSGGIITQAKADAATAKLQESRDTERKTKLTEALNSLIKAGTITQEQADKVSAYMSTLEANKPAPGTATTPKAERKNPLSALVDNGTINQTQLDAISKVLPMGGHGHGGHEGMGRTAKPSTAAAAS